MGRGDAEVRKGAREGKGKGSGWEMRWLCERQRKRENIGVRDRSLIRHDARR